MKVIFLTVAVIVGALQFGYVVVDTVAPANSVSSVRLAEMGE